jgi:hypothetical protein
MASPEELEQEAEALVRERIRGERKGAPGEPSYLHSLRVRDLIRTHYREKPQPELIQAALLHDVVKEGNVSFSELRSRGFSERTVQLVDLCTHPLEIESHSERWIRMTMRLAQAEDADAWRIKLADMTDELSRSSGLSWEKRKFMVEVKAPIFLRLGRTDQCVQAMLEGEIEQQRQEMKEQHRYVVTRWTEGYDYDGLLNDFQVLGEFNQECDAILRAYEEAERTMRVRPYLRKDRSALCKEAEKTPSRPNRCNKVVFTQQASARDEEAEYALRICVDVVEIPREAVLTRKMFDAQECSSEVRSYFEMNRQVLGTSRFFSQL